jgi:CMP-N,N'-diacetyllegionaminic acid synthase
LVSHKITRTHKRLLIIKVSNNINALITICARGGSKGIPGKNIRIINGKPLLHYTINVAKEFQQLYNDVEIILSTDSVEISKVARDYGLFESYIRPASLSGDNAGKIETIKDVLLWQESEKNRRYDFILDLDVTSPLRNLADLQNAFSVLLANAEALNIFSVSLANRNPYFNMVEQKGNGFYAQVKLPQNGIYTRQAAPKVFELNASFYFYRRKFFDEGFSGAITDKSLVFEVPHICFDLDHLTDFEFMEYLISNEKLDFEL